MGATSSKKVRPFKPLQWFCSQHQRLPGAGDRDLPSAPKSANRKYLFHGARCPRLEQVDKGLVSFVMLMATFRLRASLARDNDLQLAGHLLYLSAIVLRRLLHNATIRIRYFADAGQWRA